MPLVPPPETVPLAGLWVLFGLAALVGGAELFVLGSVRLAAALKLPTVTIGLSLVAVGTSLPELGASLGGVLRGGAAGAQLALGNALGSNVANMGLLLGLAALLRPLEGALLGSRGHALVMTGATLLVAGVGYGLGGLGRGYGAFALAAFLAYTLVLFRPRVRPHLVAPGRPRPVMPVLFLTGAGCGGVVLGAEVLVRGSVALARLLAVPADVIGASLVAVGTSLPELAVCLSAARRREGGILLGNLVGSNIANLLLVLGACALAHPLVFGGKVRVIYTPAMVALTLLTVGLVHGRRRIGRLEGGLLLTLYGVYLFFTWSP